MVRSVLPQPAAGRAIAGFAVISLDLLQSIGLSPEAAQRTQQALQGADLRGFVHELLLDGLWREVVDEAQPQPQWMER